MVPAVHETAVGQLPGRVARHLRWRVERAFEPAAPAFRRATSRLRLRPTFLVIGAQKAGTTSLYTYLAHHPAIACARPKEVHYFNVSHDLGDPWYRSHFPLITRGAEIRRRTGARAAVGEVTPGYIFHPHAPARVHAFAADMKLVAVLRDPVDRAYSQYRMQVRGFGTEETGSFEEALARESIELPPELERVGRDPSYVSPTGFRRSYVARGLYAQQLERWLEWFPREQLLVLTSEELRATPSAAMETIADFLDVPRWLDENYRMRSANEYEPVPDDLRERLAKLFEPHNRKLEGLLGRELAWTRPAATGALAGEGSQ
jgi:Sulfotransferase domain